MNGAITSRQRRKGKALSIDDFRAACAASAPGADKARLKLLENFPRSKPIAAVEGSGGGGASDEPTQDNMPDSLGAMLGTEGAIAKDDFGVSEDRSSGLATPAMAALGKAAEKYSGSSRAEGAATLAKAHKKGAMLHEEYAVVKVCRAQRAQ